MLYAGLDLSRKRLDFCLLDQLGEKVEVGAAPLTLTVCAAWPLASAASASRSSRRSSR